jgi:hypothetical protein
MSKDSFIKRWRSRFRHRKNPADHQGRDLTLATLRMVQLTREEEYSCDDVFELVDHYAEMVLRGEDVTALLPLAYRHYEMCPDCREELAALIRILETDALPSINLFTP